MLFTNVVLDKYVSYVGKPGELDVFLLVINHVNR